MKRKPPARRVRINFFLLESQKLDLQAEAKAQGITCAELLRNLVRKELYERVSPAGHPRHDVQ